MNTPSTGAAAQHAAPSDQDIVDAYHYMLGRWLVLQQEHLDFKEGFKWNEVIHREPGGVAWANPNLDVAYSEAWIAVDDTSATMLELPAIKGRYYTVQILNGWGETTANINERYYPRHPTGLFGLCLKGAHVSLPPGTERVDLPGRQSRILMRVELGADPEEAKRLQHLITLRPTGSPAIAPPVDIAIFTNDKLPGVEGFDNTDVILASEPDINPGAEPLQAKARAVARAATDSQTRSRIDDVIRQKAIPTYYEAFKKAGTTRNGWNRPATIGNYGGDYLTRSLIDLAGIWANNNKEVVYFKTDVDGTGQPLDGSNAYAITFPKEQRPESMVRYFWSVIAVDSVKFHVMDNPIKRYLLNNQSKLQSGSDGSLTLAFANKQPAHVPQPNWLPTPAGGNYNLTFRFYGPNAAIETGQYFPPPLVKQV